MKDPAATQKNDPLRLERGLKIFLERVMVMLCACVFHAL